MQVVVKVHVFVHLISEALDVQHQHAMNQLESVLEERESVLRQLDAANQGLAEHVSQAAALRRQLAEKTSSETPAREPSQEVMLLLHDDSSLLETVLLLPLLGTT